MFPILTALVLAQTPAPPAKPPAPAAAATKSMSDLRKAEMDRLIQKRKLEALKKAAARSAKAQADYKAALVQQAYLDKMIPIWQEEARKNARTAAAVQSANAMSSMANAAQREARAIEAEVRIEARQAGYPQIGLQQVVP